MITVNELFSGIGAQRAALERAGIGHRVVGISEIDKYAIKSYEAIYGETRNYGDISKVDKLDYADFWTYSFPCTDISVAGQQKGIVKGETRSGLLYEVQRLLEVAVHTHTQPKWLMLENVKNLVGKKFRAQFDEWCDWLDGIGYNTYWQVMNAKDYGVPQNRERVFAVSVRKDIDDGNFRFPDKKFLDIRLKDILEDEVDEKYYLLDKILQGLKAHNERHAEKGTGFIFKPRDTDGIASTIRANSSLCPTDNAVCIQAGSLNHYNYDEMNRVYSAEGCSPTLRTMQGGDRQPRIIVPEAYGALLQPVDRDYNKHGGKREMHVEMLDEPMSYALRANNHGAMVANDFCIRRLTPHECWRLMGFTDEAFHKAEAVCSNSQLYKQAGNSIVVDVLVGIFKNIFKED